MSPRKRSPSPKRGKVPVHIEAAERGTQIIVIDADFNKLDAGLGQLKLELPPGLYKARFKAGNRIDDQLFEVASEPVKIHGAPLQFSSPVPLQGTSNNHEYQYGPSQTLAAGAAVSGYGKGAQLFVFARDSQLPPGAKLPPPGPWAGLSLRDEDQRPLFDIERLAQVDLAGGWLGLKLDLDPGVYFLVQPDSVLHERTVQLPVVLCRGWCTLVYLDTRSIRIDAASQVAAPSRALDLYGASMLMVKQDAHGALDTEAVRLTEIARQALSRGEAAIADEDVDAMIHGKRESPILGLYAAHILLARSPVDWNLLGVMARNLKRWLDSPHPDVEVLLEVCQRHDAGAPPPERSGFWPPILAATWDFALAIDAEPPDQNECSQWLRQYRVGGSLWSCLVTPEARPKAQTSYFTDDVGQRAAETPLLSSLADWQDIVAGLAQPNLSHTPFQQALRRRVLDLVDDERTQSLNVTELADQFRILSTTAFEQYQQVKLDAAKASHGSTDDYLTL